MHRFRTWLFASLVAAPLVGCSSTLTYQPRPSPRAPEADVKITANTMKDTGQTQLEVAIQHLATPDRLFAGATAFVVWYRQNGKTPWTRIGALKYDASSREATMKAATVPETAFDLEITAEANADPSAPVNEPIVLQTVNRP